MEKGPRMILSAPMAVLARAQQLLPQWTNPGLFGITEGALVILSLAGVIVYRLKNRVFSRGHIIVLGFAVISLPSLLYRGHWTYSLLHLAFCSIYFGYLAFVIIESIGGHKKAVYTVALSFCMVALVHSASLTLYADSWWRNIQEQKRWQPFLYAIRNIDYGESIGLIGMEKMVDVNGAFNYAPYYIRGRHERREPHNDISKAMNRIFRNLPRKVSRDFLIEQKIKYTIEKHKTSGSKPTYTLKKIF